MLATAFTGWGNIAQIEKDDTNDPLWETDNQE
jgi:hypothetical protein